MKPLTLAAAFWARSDVVAALRDRDLGELYRLMRRWAGASQTQIAIAAGMTQGQVSKIMAGKRQVLALDVAERVLDGLGAPDPARLAFGLAPGTASDVWTAGRGEDVGRRDVLRMGGALAVGSALASGGLSFALLAPDGQVDKNRVSTADLAVSVRRAWELRQRADYEALGRLLPGLIASAEAGVESLSDAGRDQAARLLVHTYNVASSLLRTLGDGALALLAADRAVYSARMVGEPVLIAAAMYRLANVLLSAGRTEECAEIALRAADLTSPGTSHDERGLAMWGGLLLTAAVASAQLGREPEAWELLGQARAGAQMLDRDFADMFAIFGPTNVAIHGVQVAVTLGRGGDAVRRSGTVDSDRLPASLVERRGQYLIDVASGHALEGHDGPAIETLRHAEGVAPQQVRLSEQARALTRTLLGRERPGRAPGLRELAERVGVLT